MGRFSESEEIYKRIGQNVAKRRRELGLSQTELAERCDITRGSIANIESGKQRATLHTLLDIAKALEVDMLLLLASSEADGEGESKASDSFASAWLQEKPLAFLLTSIVGGGGLAALSMRSVLGLASGVGGVVAASAAAGIVARKLVQKMGAEDSSRDAAASPPIPIKKLEKQAEKLVQQAGIKTIPVPVEAVAKHLGIKIDEADLGDDCSGILIREGDSAVIGVHADHHEHRKRFTIAHEIAHYTLHKREAYIDQFHIDLRTNNPGSATKQEEDEANRFAGALLMPADQVRKAFAEQRVDPSRDDEIPEMAKRFKVSVQAMTKRLMHLDLISAD